MKLNEIYDGVVAEGTSRINEKTNQRVGKRIGGVVPNLIVLEFRDRYRDLEEVNRREEWRPKRLPNR
jgi:hypothetical protein